MEEKPKSIENVRHSLAHLLALAALKFDPQAKLGVGPVIENGFYYDIQFSKKVSEEILSTLENMMRLYIQKGLPFKEVKVSTDEAKKLFKKLKQPFKIELVKDLEKYGTTDPEIIDLIKNKKRAAKPLKYVTLYWTGDIFVDLCRGGHVENTKEIPLDTFKLEKIAGAYWRGSEKNPMLTRIYGVAFETREELEEYFKKIEEAKKRDHRRLGEDLRLFTFSHNVGAGLPLWLPNGAIIRQIIQEYLYEKYKEYEYQIVFTPHITKETLFKISGHLEHYRENMYAPIEIEGEKYYLKPMNCPMHLMIYQTWPKSYRDLPIRYGELGTVYRYEKSGTLSGLTRVRGFTQDDGHIICRPDQIESEIKLAVKMVSEVLHDFGLSVTKVDLSVWDKKRRKDYLGTISDWENAISALKKTIEEFGWAYEEKIGEAAFYGPKIDVKIEDALGREWQLSTIQLDFNLPKKFRVVYFDKDSKPKYPYMIHRAILGSIERFFGILIEHYAGEFPLWLTPLQVVVLPIKDENKIYAEEIFKELKSENIRADLWPATESLSKRILKAEGDKVPYMIIVGEKEEKTKKISIRKHKVGDLGEEELKKFILMIKRKITTKDPTR
jgi:threonyl-tRNA synthetase